MLETGVPNDQGEAKMYVLGSFSLAFSILFPAESMAEPAKNNAATLQAISALNTLQGWYNHGTGLWDSTGWWNSANVLTTLADFNAFELSLNATIRNVFNNTFLQAPLNNPTVVKVKTLYSIDSYTKWPPAYRQLGTTSNASAGFANNFYDDEGWWALAWLKVYQITDEQRYLQSAIDLYEDMMGGYNATCGGIWWDKGHQHNTAIANELFLAVAVRLAIQVPGNEHYSSWALKQWDWFRHSGMLQADYTISDGLNLETCKPEHGIIWTYTHGVIIGALIDLNLLSPNPTYLYTAWRIAHAAIGHFSDSHGILHEPCEPNCGADGPQFKGVFLRNLQRLQEVLPDPSFKHFIDKNVYAIWTFDRDRVGRLGLVWSGPYLAATASTHSSACDTLVAAAAAEEKKYNGKSAVQG